MYLSSVYLFPWIHRSVFEKHLGSLDLFLSIYHMPDIYTAFDVLHFLIEGDVRESLSLVDGGTHSPVPEDRDVKIHGELRHVSQN
jgi:hypothetical protein